MTDRQPQSIVILRLGALGDVCLTIPLINLLRRHLPQTKIYWIISRGMVGLISGLEGVEFIVVEKPHRLKDYLEFRKLMINYHFDVALLPQATLRTNLLIPLIPAKLKYGYDKLHSRDLQRIFVNRIVPAKAEHLLDSFLRFAEPFGILDKTVEWNIPLDHDEIKFAQQKLPSFDGKWLAICAATSKEERNWFVERYVEVIEKVSQQYAVKVVLVGGPSELEKWMGEQIASQCSVDCLNLIAGTNLKQLVAVLQRSDLLLSPDTGPLHIAQAVGTPVVGLYAVAPAEKTGPYFSQSLVINKFTEAVKTFLNKDPKTISWHDRVHNRDAMKLITVDEVVAKIIEVIRKD